MCGGARQQIAVTVAATCVEAPQRMALNRGQRAPTTLTLDLVVCEHDVAIFASTMLQFPGGLQVYVA